MCGEVVRLACLHLPDVGLLTQALSLALVVMQNMFGGATERFGERVPSKNIGPRSPMREPSPWQNPPDPWVDPGTAAVAAAGGAASPRPKRNAGQPITAGLSPLKMNAPRKFVAAGSATTVKHEDGTITERSTASARYSIICKRLYVLPDPVYERALSGEHDGEYSTAKAEVRLDPDGIFAIVSVLELCRGLHTVRLVGLQRGGATLLRREVLEAAFTVVRKAAPLKVLDLSCSALDDELVAEPLKKLLAGNTNLTCLLLRSNYLGPLSAKALLSTISHNRTLLELDVADNAEWRWPGQPIELNAFLKTNTTLLGFGASLRPEAAEAVINYCVRSPARMRKLALTMLPLSEVQVSNVAALVATKQVRPLRPSATRMPRRHVPRARTRPAARSPAARLAAPLCRRHCSGTPLAAIAPPPVPHRRLYRGAPGSHSGRAFSQRRTVKLGPMRSRAARGITRAWAMPG